MSTFFDKLSAAFGDQVRVEADTVLEQYCKKNYKLIPKIAYQNKRKYNDKPVSVYLNELITPGAFEVDKLFSGVYPTGTNKAIAGVVGRKVARKLTWTSDSDFANSDDYYLYPSEALVQKECDCEDHAFVVASCHKELGVAYGFYDGGGHAFNVFVEDGKLYVLDTVGDSAYIEEYSSNSKYVIHYIITKNFTFEVKRGARFGEIAGW